MFVHMAALPKEQAARAFAPARDIREGNLVAILMDDQDVVEWDRLFDIALVMGVTPIGIDGKVLFKVKYYDCDYVCQECRPKRSLVYLAEKRYNWMGGVARGPTLERSNRTTCCVKHG